MDKIFSCRVGPGVPDAPMGGEGCVLSASMWVNLVLVALIAGGIWLGMLVREERRALKKAAKQTQMRRRFATRERKESLACRPTTAHQVPDLARRARMTGTMRRTRLRRSLKDGP